MDLVREILPVLDDFERALKVETADREYAKGMELIYQRLSTRSRSGAGADRNRRASSSTPTCTRPWSGCETEEAEDQAILGEFQKRL